MNLGNQLYGFLGKQGQAQVDRLRYSLGLLPRVRRKDLVTAGLYTPPSKACFIISADFELAWAWRYAKSYGDPLAYARHQADQTRRNFDGLLGIFDHYNAPVTWATVGHLFLDHCDRNGNEAHVDVRRIRHFENEYWRFCQGDWFDADPCSNLQQDPEWYAPDLIRKILDAEVSHEIGCHSFSHIAFSNDICQPEVASSELRKCVDIAQLWGLKLTSFVFPANLAGNFASLKQNGFTSYRWHNGTELGVPRKDEFDLWQIPGGICWEKPPRWSVRAWIKALQRCVDRAIDTGTILHLWFHPSCEPVNVEMVFPTLLEYVVARRDIVWMTTMDGLVNRLAQIEA